jgi:hypothetical protein
MNTAIAASLRPIGNRIPPGFFGYNRAKIRMIGNFNPCCPAKLAGYGQ